MPAVVDVAGQKFGRLMVLHATGGRIRGRIEWLCQCECGGLLRTNSNQLRSGTTKSCGCLSIEKFRGMITKHGGRWTTTYNTWLGMKQRCHYTKHVAWDRYGGLGLKVCEAWRDSFQQFLADMGEKPIGKSIDRIDNDLGYDCGKCEDCVSRSASLNCRWSTSSEQRRNQRAVAA